MSAPYRPGQPPWPDNRSQRPDRPPPPRFHEEPPSSGTSPLDWALRIAGLVAVAVISGVAWWFFTSEDTPERGTTGFGGGPTSQQNEGEFPFTSKLSEPRVDESCAEHAYGQIQDFFGQTPCRQLTRDVFTTEIDDRTVYTSVSVVRMADEAQAQELRVLTDKDGSGNVNDLVREREVRVSGLEALSGGGGYDSSLVGSEVIIVEADYDPSAANGGTEDELDRVCEDALRLAKDMTGGSG
ncbi:hypothetical protein [Actinophytocola xanthii]|uniref:hypothetical protein n=1 Tax=Actinophytocola xanthii TaxID=1912961 RepID=UPI0011784B54|nr:hypothetical protein [Actinophytocola xanthii]